MSLAWFWSLLLIGGTVLLSIAGTLIVRRLAGVEVLERHNEVAGFIYAVLGIVAAAGVIAASLFHIAWADGLASIAIGLLLASVAFVLANETRSLIAGEAVAPIVMERLKEARARIGCITSLDEVATLHLGPGKILVALTLALRRDSTTDAIEEAIREVTEALLRKAHERVVYVYVRPSDKA